MDEARLLLEASLKGREALSRAEPKDLRVKCDLGLTHYALGDLAGVENRFTEAYRVAQARDLLIPLASDPDVDPTVSAEAAQKLFGLAQWADGRGLGELARSVFKSTIHNEAKYASGTS